MSSMFEPVVEAAVDRTLGRWLGRGDQRRRVRKLQKPEHRMLCSLRATGDPVEGLDAGWHLGEARLATGTLTFAIAGKRKQPYTFAVVSLEVLVRDQRDRRGLHREPPYSLVKVVTRGGELEWSMSPELVDPAIALLRPVTT